MTDDLLARAARALREETAGDDASARFTRSRIMASVHDERVKRRTRWAFLIPIAATFVAASAFGAATGKTHAVMLVITRALGIHREEAPPARPVPRHAVARPFPSSAPVATPSTVAAPSAGASDVAPPPEPPAVPEPPPAAKGERALTSGTPGLAAAAPSHALPAAGDAAADPTFELYRTAHQAHFVDRDYARALGAWDAYLRAAPHGALAPEARYNRALCLVRLHLNDEARSALAPFAEGRYGTYRREDAQRLIAALPPEQSGP
ncbi:MAG TPA: hypothetical protein VMI54_21320 [Polyangiaceae bacterium]|nr:hypothetical protein [Polyangiaceae bacterium]